MVPAAQFTLFDKRKDFTWVKQGISGGFSVPLFIVEMVFRNVVVKERKVMISSRNNPKLKRIKKLQTSSKARNEENVFVVEGPKMVFEVPPGGLLECFVGESFFNKNKDKIIKEGCSYELVSDECFGLLSDTKTPQGILGVIKQPEVLLEELWGGGEQTPLLLFLESIQDPGNLGTIVRTAEAAGVTGIIMNGKCADIYNPKTIRSTMGAIYRMPSLVVSNFEETLAKGKALGVKLVATHTKATKNYDEENYQEAVGFIIGNESVGLSPSSLQWAHQWVKIPMKGQAESLNAAVATGILIYEAYRQRG